MLILLKIIISYLPDLLKNGLLVFYAIIIIFFFYFPESTVIHIRVLKMIDKNLKLIV